MTRSGAMRGCGLPAYLWRTVEGHADDLRYPDRYRDGSPTAWCGTVFLDVVDRRYGDVGHRQCRSCRAARRVGNRRAGGGRRAGYWDTALSESSEYAQAMRDRRLAESH